MSSSCGILIASGAGAKVRPALVVQNDRNNARMTITILAAITTTSHRNHESTQLLIEVATPAGQQSGLLRDSVVTCENLVTVEISLIQRTIGTLPADVMSQVNDCLGVSLGLR
jgi:mRNA-degrading endonuclease toxin of MazEF toxin-antitoxin module